MPSPEGPRNLGQSASAIMFRAKKVRIRNLGNNCIAVIMLLLEMVICKF